MQTRSRPHRIRYKRMKIPSNKLPYICEDDDRFNAKGIYDKYESDFYADTAIRRATRWFKSHKTIPIHKVPRHMREKFSMLEAKLSQ